MSVLEKLRKKIDSEVQQRISILVPKLDEMISLLKEQTKILKKILSKLS